MGMDQETRENSYRAIVLHVTSSMSLQASLVAQVWILFYFVLFSTFLFFLFFLCGSFSPCDSSLSSGGNGSPWAISFHRLSPITLSGSKIREFTLSKCRSCSLGLGKYDFFSEKWKIRVGGSGC